MHVWVVAAVLVLCACTTEQVASASAAARHAQVVGGATFGSEPFEIFRGSRADYVATLAPGVVYERDVMHATTNADWIVSVSVADSFPLSLSPPLFLAVFQDLTVTELIREGDGYPDAVTFRTSAIPLASLVNVSFVDGDSAVVVDSTQELTDRVDAGHLRPLIASASPGSYRIPAAAVPVNGMIRLVFVVFTNEPMADEGPLVVRIHFQTADRLGSAIAFINLLGVLAVFLPCCTPCVAILEYACCRSKRKKNKSRLWTTYLVVTVEVVITVVGAWLTSVVFLPAVVLFIFSIIAAQYNKVFDFAHSSATTRLIASMGADAVGQIRIKRKIGVGAGDAVAAARALAADATGDAPDADVSTGVDVDVPSPPSLPWSQRLWRIAQGPVGVFFSSGLASGLVVVSELLDLVVIRASFATISIPIASRFALRKAFVDANLGWLFDGFVVPFARISAAFSLSTSGWNCGFSLLYFSALSAGISVIIWLCILKLDMFVTFAVRGEMMTQYAVLLPAGASSPVLAPMPLADRIVLSILYRGATTLILAILKISALTLSRSVIQAVIPLVQALLRPVRTCDTNETAIVFPLIALTLLLIFIVLCTVAPFLTGALPLEAMSAWVKAKTGNIDTSARVAPAQGGEVHDDDGDDAEEQQEESSAEDASVELVAGDETDGGGGLAARPGTSPSSSELDDAIDVASPSGSEPESFPVMDDRPPSLRVRVTKAAKRAVQRVRRWVFFVVSRVALRSVDTRASLDPQLESSWSPLFNALYGLRPQPTVSFGEVADDDALRTALAAAAAGAKDAAVATAAGRAAAKAAMKAKAAEWKKKRIGRSKVGPANGDMPAADEEEEEVDDEVGAAVDEEMAGGGARGGGAAEAEAAAREDAREAAMQLAAHEVPLSALRVVRHGSAERADRSEMDDEAWAVYKADALSRLPRAVQWLGPRGVKVALRMMAAVAFVSGAWTPMTCAFWRIGGRRVSAVALDGDGPLFRALAGSIGQLWQLVPGVGAALMLFTIRSNAALLFVPRSALRAAPRKAALAAQWLMVSTGGAAAGVLPAAIFDGGVHIDYGLVFRAAQWGYNMTVLGLLFGLALAPSAALLISYLVISMVGFASVQAWKHWLDRGVDSGENPLAELDAVQEGRADEVGGSGPGGAVGGRKEETPEATRRPVARTGTTVSRTRARRQRRTARPASRSSAAPRPASRSTATRPAARRPAATPASLAAATPTTTAAPQRTRSRVRVARPQPVATPAAPGAPQAAPRRRRRRRVVQP